MIWVILFGGLRYAWATSCEQLDKGFRHSTKSFAVCDLPKKSPLEILLTIITRNFDYKLQNLLQFCQSTRIPRLDLAEVPTRSKDGVASDVRKEPGWR